MIYVVCALVFIIFLCVLVIVLQKNTKDKLKNENIKLKNQNASLEEEVKQLSAVSKIKEENNDEAEKKYNELFTGDVVANAINGLSKPKN